MPTITDPDIFLNQLLLVTSVAEANALIADNREHITRLFIQRVFQTAHDQREVDPTAARGLLDVLLYTVQQIDDPLLMGDVLSYHADWERREGQFDRLPSLYMAALEAYRKVPEQTPEEIARCLFNIGFVFFQEGDFGRAIVFLEQAIVHDLTTDQPERAIRALHLRGRIAYFQGDLSNAQRHFEQALMLAEHHNITHEVVAQLNNLGILHSERHDLDAAERCYRQVLERSRAKAYPAGEAMALGNLGVIAQGRGSLDEAEILFTQAATLDEQLSDTENRANDLSNLGLVAALRGNYAQAVTLYVQALSLARQARNSPRQVLALNNLGAAYHHLGDLSQTEAHYREALALSEQSDSHSQVEAHSGLGSIAQERGDNAQAEVAYARAVALVEKMRSGVIEVEYRAALFRSAIDAYTGLVLLCLRRRNPSEALAYIERARSRSFLDLLRVGSLQPDRHMPEVAANLLARETELLGRLRTWQLARPAADVPRDPAQLLTDLEAVYVQRDPAQLLAELEAVYNELQAHVPEYVALRRGTPVSVRELRHICSHPTRAAVQFPSVIDPRH